MNQQQEVIGYKIIEAIISVIWHPGSKTWGENAPTGPKIRNAIPIEHRKVGEAFITTQFTSMVTLIDELPLRDTLWTEWREYCKKTTTRKCMVSDCQALVIEPNRMCPVCRVKGERGEL